MEEKLNELVKRLKKALEDRLVSVILYGSAASEDYQEQFSDLNIFCVLRQVSPAELADCEPVFRWWIREGHPAPLLMSEDEVARSTDCFPIEFQDMQARRRLLHGKDVVQSLVIEGAFYRAEVEYELRSKLLRLRQKAAGVLQDSELLVRLMADSVSTFLVLARHVVLLSGSPCGSSRRDTLSGMSAVLGIDPAPFRTLLDLREGTVNRRALDATALFTQYLKGVQNLVTAVDRIHR
jgi:hypothetical protein